MSFICMRMTNHLHIKGWALNLVLIQRPGGTRKWLIAERVHLTRPQSCLSLLLIRVGERDFLIRRSARPWTGSIILRPAGKQGSIKNSPSAFRVLNNHRREFIQDKNPYDARRKVKKDLALVALALLMYAFVRNQAVWVASTDKTNWRIIIYVSGKLPTYPSPKSTLTLSSHFGQNIGLRDG